MGSAAAEGIVVSGLARSFGGVQAVRSVDLVARPGEVTALIGPNGAGKTTLLLMLATLLVPDRGTMRIDGLDPVADPRAVRRRIGWMPDALGSWSALTVATTLELTARLYGIPKPAAAARAAALVEELGLAPLAAQPTRVLSRGQKQRLGLARALVHDPGVLLLDEPASGLDPGARIELRHRVRALAADGRTVLISSHVLAELDEMADAAVYLDAGETASAERVAAARTRARDWRIRSLDDDALPGRLARLGVEPATLRRDGGGLLVPIADDDAAADLLAELVAAGARITAFAPAVGDLEHTFLDLSGEERP
jgi:ABC-type multidrug transport system ATPase subunit